MGSTRYQPVVLFLCVALSRDARPDVTAIRSESAVGEWLVDESSGRIFASLPDDGTIAEFSPTTGKALNTLSVEGSPRTMVVKARRLVVAVKESRAFHLAIFDLEKDGPPGQPEKVGLDATLVQNLFCSRAENPYVYVHGSDSPPSTKASVLQVDVVKRGSPRAVDIDQREWNSRVVRHVTMATTGRALVLDDRRVNDMARYVRLFDVDEANASFRSRGGPSIGGGRLGRIAAGPAGRFWATGSKLVDFDLKKEIRVFSGFPWAFHPKTDLVAAFTFDRSTRTQEYVLAFETFQSSEPIGKVPLTTLLVPQDAVELQQMRVQFEPIVQIDPNHDRVFVAWGNRAAVFDLTDLNLPSRPLVLIAMDTTASVDSSQTLRVPLSLSNPELMRKCRFAVDSGPTGMRVTGQQLTWTPTDADVGVHDVRIKAVADGTEDIANLRIDVSRPAIELGMSPGALVVDPSAPRALLVDRIQNQPSSAADGKSRIVVVDTENRTVLVKKAWDKQFSAVHIDESGVYLATQPGGFFYKFERDTFEFKRRVFVEDMISSFATLPKGKLGVVVGGSLRVYDSATLKPVDTYPGTSSRALARMSFHPSQRPTTELEDGLLLVANRVIERSTGELRLIAGSPLLTDIVSSTPRIQSLPSRWNRSASNGQLTRSTRSSRGSSRVAIASWSAPATVLLRSLPAVASIRIEGTQAPEYRETVRLEFRDLTEGRVRSDVLLSDRYREDRNRYPTRSVPLLEEGKGQVLATHREALYVVPFPRGLADELPQPVRFRYRQDPIEVTVDDVARVSFSAVGGTGRLNYELLNEVPHTRIDAATGAVTVDGPALWDAYLTGIREGRTRYGVDQFPPRPQRSQPGEAYRDITGEDLPEGKLVFSLPLHLGVTDEEAQDAQLIAYLLLIAPKTELDAASAEWNDEVARRQQEAKEKRDAQRQAAAAAAGSSALSLDAQLRTLQIVLGDISKRLDAIELRLQKLEQAQKDVSNESE